MSKGVVTNPQRIIAKLYSSPAVFETAALQFKFPLISTIPMKKL